MQIKNSVFLVTGGASGLGRRDRTHGRGKRRQGSDRGHAGELGEKFAREIGGRFAKCDVTSEADGKAAVALALKEFGGLHVLVNCAGIAIAEKTIGKEAPHALASFTRCITVNLIGTFNMIRLAADAMAKAVPNAAGERGVISQHRVGRRVRRPDRPGRVFGVEGGVVGMTLPVARDCRATASASARSRRESSRRRCCSACRRKRRTRSASRCRFHRASGGRSSTRSSRARSSRTKCSTGDDPPRRRYPDGAALAVRMRSSESLFFDIRGLRYHVRHWRGDPRAAWCCCTAGWTFPRRSSFSSTRCRPTGMRMRRTGAAMA
jgi:hypothetical protein